MITLLGLSMLLLICPATVNANSVTGSVTVRLGIYEVSASNIGYYSATINWKTNGNSTSQVFYDTVYHDNVTDYRYYTSEDITFVSVHSVTLTGLSSATTYHFQVRSAIPDTEFIAISDDYAFTTLTPYIGGGAAPPPPPGTTPVSDIVTTGGVFTKTAALKSADAKVEVTIPKDTVGKTKEGTPLTKLTVAPMTTPPAPPAQANVIGLTYDFGPEGATFDPPITVSFTYDPSAIPAGVNEKDLAIAFYDTTAGNWVTLTGITVDPVTHTISGKTSHFTAFTVVAYTRPAAFTLSDLIISPTELKVGESVSISVNIANTGDLADTSSVTLKVNNIVVETKQVTLTGRASQKITFTTSRDAAGTCAVSIDTLSSTFTVKAVPPPTPTPPPPPPPPALAAFSLSNLSIKPAEVQPNEPITITMSVTNTGSMEGSHMVVLKINDIREAEKSLTLGAGKSQEVSFRVTREKAGSYSVTVDGLSGSFTVDEVPPVKPPVNWPLIGGIIAAVVVMGLLIFFLDRRRRA